MLVGDPMDRERPANMRLQNCFRCYTGPNFGGDVGAPCQDARYEPQLTTQLSFSFRKTLLTVPN